MMVKATNIVAQATTLFTFSNHHYAFNLWDLSANS